MTTENQTMESLSLGQQLKNARLALNLSLEEVAAQTNLKKTHIDSLENDIFILPSVPPTFVRGYVRNYVRFLRLPETLVGSVNYGEVTIPQTTKKAAPIKVSNPKSQTRWVKPLTYLILLSAVGMTLAWWWQEHQKENASREQIVATEVTAQAENTSNMVVVEPQQPTLSPLNQPVASEVTINSPLNTETAAQANLVSANTNEQAAPVDSQQNVPASEPAQVAATQPTIEPNTEAVNILQQAQTEESVSEEQAIIGNDELRIEITGKESWVTVRNNSSKKSLAEKLYSNGEVLTFNGNEQYRLTIGAPANVKLYYKGELVPLKIDGRVARIRLPLAQ